MKRTLVRYKAAPDKVQENERLIGKVFEELKTKAPDGVRYMALRLGDGAFIHFAIVDTKDGSNPLVGLEAFRAFQSGIKERCIEPPQPNDAVIIGNYRMLS